MLGDEEIYEGNMLSYLGIIEQRTNELLQAYAMYKDSKAMADPLHDTLRAPAVCSLVSAAPAAPAGTRACLLPRSPHAAAQLVAAPHHPSSYFACAACGSPQHLSDVSSANRCPPRCSQGTRILVEPPSSRILPDQEEEESDVDEDGPMSREAITQRLAKTLPGKLDTAIRIRPAASRKPKPKAFRG